MLERIERISRIKRLKFNSNELFERKKGFAEKEHHEPFSSIFEDEIEKKRKKESEEHMSNDSYSLSVGRPTQSLFYQGKADISNMQGKLPNAG